jgi:hypothetical protein
MLALALRSSVAVAGSLRVLAALALVALLVPAGAAAAQDAALRGTVRDRAGNTPVAGAQVTLPGLSRGALSDSLGRFAVEGIPGGTHDVQVQRLGYAPLQMRVTVSAGATAEHTLLLVAAPTAVAPVTVTAAAVPARMRPFEARRQRGTGFFLTREQLERQGDRKLSEIMRRAVPGLRMVNSGDGSGVFIATERGTGTTPGALSGKPPRPCYAQVFMDGMRIYGQSWGRDATSPPPDLNSFAAHGIEAIEFYRPGGGTPPEFRTDTSQCGTLVIWTRDR